MDLIKKCSILRDTNTSYSGSSKRVTIYDGWCPNCYPGEMLPIVDECRDCKLIPDNKEIEKEKELC